MKGDQDVSVDSSVAWATPRRLRDLSPNREDSVLIGNEPPNGIASLKTETIGDWRHVKGRFILTRSGTNSSSLN